MPSANAIAEDLHTVLQNYKAHKESYWDKYFERCDLYYSGFRRNRYWPGTKTQRANLKLQISADVTETLYSSLCHTLFYSGGENFFDTVSEDVIKAQNMTDRLRFLLHAPIDMAGRTSFWALKRGLRYILRYGIGPIGIRYAKEIERPKLVAISPYDLIWSPTASELIDDSPKVFHRFFRTIEELEALRGVPGYHIPSFKRLKNFLQEGAEARQNMSDQSKRDAVEAQLEENVAEQLIREPEMDKLEIYRVSTKSFIYWLIIAGQQQELIYAATNTLETQPYVAGFYRPTLASIGGSSPVQLLSGEHDLQQTLTNSMLDAVDLAITPPMRSGPGQDKQKVWGPAVAYQGANEKLNAPIMGATFPREAIEAYVESQRRVNRIAGTNEMAMTGRPAPSNANRTLGGMQLQDAARDQRSFGIVEEIESTMVVPALLKLALLDKATIGQGTEGVPALNGDRQMNTITPEALPESIHIEVRGATRMVGISRLAGALEPLFQYAFSPQIQQVAMKSGSTLDFQQIDKFVNEALGFDRKFKFFRQATEEERAMTQQAELQKAQIQAQSRQQSDELRSRTQLALEQIKQAGLSDERAMKILELLVTDQQTLNGLKAGLLQGRQQQNNPDNSDQSE